MSLRDKACYTLTLVPSLSDPKVLELIESQGNLPLTSTPGPSTNGQARYARVREQREGESYSSIIYDAYSGAKLASVGFVNEKIKSRRLELHGPDVAVPFEFTGKIGFEWSFTFENNIYRWKREFGVGRDMICSLDRKPDPPVEICLGREADKNSPGQIQILHYNVDRFFGHEIQDLRGLETLLVTSLVCFIDAVDDRSNASASRSRPSLSVHSSDKRSEDKVPVEDPVIEDPNEIIVGVHTDLDTHVARAIGLLEDKNVLFIVIRSKSSAAASRAMEVSLGVTRFRHRESLPELHQYLVEDVDADPPPPVPKGPRVINLDDPPPAPAAPKENPKWKAPTNITIYLSTIELPDLRPGRREASASASASGSGSSSTSKPPPSEKPNGASKPAQSLSAGSVPLRRPGSGGSNGGGSPTASASGSASALGSGSGSANGDGGSNSKRLSSFGKVFKQTWNK